MVVQEFMYFAAAGTGEVRNAADLTGIANVAAGFSVSHTAAAEVGNTGVRAAGRAGGNAGGDIRDSRDTGVGTRPNLVVAV